MNLVDLVQEVNERTHMGELEILEIIRHSWPGRAEFSTETAKLLIKHIERTQMVEVRGPLTDEQLWGIAQ